MSSKSNHITVNQDDTKNLDSLSFELGAGTLFFSTEDTTLFD